VLPPDDWNGAAASRSNGDARSPRVAVVASTEDILDRLGLTFEVTQLSASAGASHDHTVCRDSDVFVVDASQEMCLELVEELSKSGHCPIVVIGTHRGARTDALRYLNIGADDHVSRDAPVTEWAARIRAAARRGRGHAAAQHEPTYRFGDVTISPAERLVTKGGEEVRLTPTEFNLLEALAERADEVVPHHKLIAEVWGAEYVSARHYLRVYVRRLRERLEDDPANPVLIATEWGTGYVLRSGLRVQPPHDRVAV
jgi:two-component system KDP operon response regulator KdpE